MLDTLTGGYLVGIQKHNDTLVAYINHQSSFSWTYLSSWAPKKSMELVSLCLPARKRSLIEVYETIVLRCAQEKGIGSQ